MRAVAAGDMPVVASGAFSTFARFVVAFGLAGVFADLTMELDHLHTHSGWAVLSRRLGALFLIDSVCRLRASR